MMASALCLRLEGEEDNTCHAHGHREDALPATTSRVQNVNHDVMQKVARFEKERIGTVPQRRGLSPHSHAK
jgi:hypothetical protein